MPFSRRLRQSIEQAAADPVLRIRLNPYAPGNLIRRRESDSPDILRQAIRIDLHDLIQISPVGLPDPRGMRAPDSVFLQKDHGVPKILFVLHLRPDLTRHPKADPLDLRQLLRLLLHDPERIIPETFHDFGGHRGTDPFDTPGRKIPVHGLGVFRSDHLIIPDTHLLPVNRMRDILSRDGTALPLADRNRSSDTGDHIPDRAGGKSPFPSGSVRRSRLSRIRNGHFKYRIPALLTAIYDMRNKALKISHSSSP